MALTRDKELTLSALFSTWGLENVRAEFGNEAHAAFNSPDVVAFAHEWIRAEEERQKHRSHGVWVTIIMAASVLTGTAMAVLTPGV